MGDADKVIRVIVNGKETELPVGTTVASFLDRKGLQERLVVVELNETIVPRPEFATTELSAGDVVEVVHFVGGG